MGFFEDIELLGKDAYISGKEDGYDFTAKKLKPDYEKLEKEYDETIERLKQETEGKSDLADYLIEKYERLIKEKEQLERKKVLKIQSVSKSFEISTDSIERAMTVGTLFVDLVDPWFFVPVLGWAIMAKKKEYAKGFQKGIIEARDLFDKKRKNLADKLKTKTAEAKAKIKELVDMINRVNLEIGKIKNDISELEIALRRN